VDHHITGESGCKIRRGFHFSEFFATVKTMNKSKKLAKKKHRKKQGKKISLKHR